MSDDLWMLLPRWQAGDQAAGSEIIDRVHPRVARFFRNKVVRVPDDDDLTQQTILALLEVKERSAEISSFWALVFKIARNVLNRYVRQKYKRAREQTDFASVCVQDLAPRAASSLAVRGLELRAFVDSLRQVPLRDQTLLELRYFEGLTAREIGELLELPRGSIHRELESSIERLRVQVDRCLSGYDAGSPAASLEDFESWSRSIRERLR